MFPARVVTTALTLAVGGSLLAGAAPASAKRAELPRFKTCGGLVEFGRQAAVEPPVYGWLPALWQTGASIDPRKPQADPGPKPDYGDKGGIPPMAMPATADSATSGAAGGESESSSTNVQEAGVDEPDIVKTSGTKLFMIAGKQLLVVETAGAQPQVIGKLALPARGGSLLVLGKRMLVIGPAKENQQWGGDMPVPMPMPARRAQMTEPAPVPAPPAPAPSVVPPPDVSMPRTDSVAAPKNPDSLLQEVDLTDPAKPTVLRSMTVPGTVASARMSDGVVRLVVNSIATLPEAPDGEEGLPAKRAKRLKVNAFVPRTIVDSDVTGKTYRRNLVPCDDVRHPKKPTGTNLVSVLTVDMDRGLINVDRDGILAAAQTVYASTSALYVGASRSAAVDQQADVPAKPVTELHRFPYNGRETEYGGGGTVRGVLLSQYSLSEYKGKLRVATSDSPGWWSGTGDENQLSVLEPQGRSLVQIGFTGGLGKNERIYAARLIGDRGYLVTFRRTDPLYVLDLSDPTAPKTTGELKIPGYSAYLHPVGDDLLLGAGQDGTETGRITGPQLSLFDVKDPAKPTRIAQSKPLPGENTYGSFLVENDPHAFLWWPQTGQALASTQTSYLGWGQQAAPLVSVKPSRGAGLPETGRLEHGPAWDHPAIERVVIAGGKVIAVSDLGVSVSDLGTLAVQSFAPLAE